MKRFRTALVVVGSFLAICIYGVGLLAPLTPSEGVAALSDMLLFAGVPTGLLLGCGWLSGSKATRILLWSLAIVVLAFSTHLVFLQAV